jgi:exopolyphosphatase/guanosine-5'-triphosphate,3'-diphosphate pyrophosphatase
MAKITAVIDIGSNSARMIVCQKSSRYAFHIIHEAKSRVRISQDCYEHGGVLQEFAMQRAIKALQDFKEIAKSLKCKKILCVATSALRDAPNRQEFIHKVKKEVGINIKVIDGRKEAYLGGLAALNLLPMQDEAVTIDIGGGSTELALMQNGKIIQTLSVDLGTIRLKELFYDKKANYRELESYIKEKLSLIPPIFKTKKAIAIGGTARAISKLLMPKDYPLKTLHAYEYDLSSNVDLLKKISSSSILKLKKYNIKKHRIDTFREGVGIFVNVLEFLGIQRVITSGVGVREGVYLSDLLRSSNLRFPQNFNPSLRSLSDRFLINKEYANRLKIDALKLFDILKVKHKIDDRYKEELKAAAKLSSIGSSINYYRNNEHSFYLILNGLNYAYTHSQKLLIAFITLYQNKKLPKEEHLSEYLGLLPQMSTVQWLSFILALSKCIHKNLSKVDYEFSFEEDTLTIKAKDKKCYLSSECIKELYKPFPIAIITK